MDRRQFVVLGATGLVGGLAGCSGTTPTDTAEPTDTPTDAATDTAEPTATSTPEPTDSPTDTAEPTATEATDPGQVVTVGPDGDFQFEPASFTVAAGDTVKWVWESGGHNVVPDEQPSGASWAGTAGSGGDTYPSGYTYSHTFETAGEYSYYCAPHQSLDMTGSFSVE